MTAKRVCSVCGAEYEADQKFCPNDGSPLRSTEATDGLVGQIIADRYRVISTLGEGGMGRVYLAEHVRMGRQCAVKVISPALASTDAAIARFNREAANASQINHPNVVQVYDFGEGPNHTLYLAMEYVKGETMSALIRREGPIALRRAASLTKQVADALAAAHHGGIVHRDLKPDNILITRQFDGTESVKVVDFGIAKTVQADGATDERGGQTVTTVGVSIGTPEYMSPEQLAGERLDTRTDLYSLGLVFFHLLTAELAYPRVTSREALIRRLMSPPRTLRDVGGNHDWPETLQPVLDRAMASDRDQRYATATEFAKDLSALIAAAPPESEATVRLRSSAAAMAFAPTEKDITPAAHTLRENTPLPTAAPGVEVPAKRRTMSIGIGLAAAAVVVAIAAFALTRDRAEPTLVATQVPADSATGLPSTAAVDSSTIVAPAQPDSTPRPVSQSAPAPSDTVRSKTVAPAPATPKPVEATSVAAATASGIDRAPPQLQRLRQNLVLRHPSLRPNGDSGTATALPLNASIPERLDAIQREVDGHVALGRRNVIGGDVTKARAEFRQAMQEVGNALTLLPNNPDALRMRDSVSKSIRGVVMQCQTAMQRGVLRISEPGFRCPSLVPRPPGARGRGSE